MKRLNFKKPFNGVGNALQLIPESYREDKKVFEMTDGNENYRVRWEGSLNEGKAVVLMASDDKLINEDMQKMKHLMGYKSEDTLGTLKGSERINENDSFGDVFSKTKKLLNESEEEEEKEVINENATASGSQGFANEGNLEEDESITEDEEAEEVVADLDAFSQNEEEVNEEKDRFDEIFEGFDEDEELSPEQSDEMDTDNRVERFEREVRDRWVNSNALTEKGKGYKIGNGVWVASLANGIYFMYPIVENEEIDKIYKDKELERINNDWMGQKVENILQQELEEGLSPEQSDEMDTDKDGDIDAKDLENLRKKKVTEELSEISQATALRAREKARTKGLDADPLSKDKLAQQDKQFGEYGLKPLNDKRVDNDPYASFKSYGDEIVTLKLYDPKSGDADIIRITKDDYRIAKSSGLVSNVSEPFHRALIRTIKLTQQEMGGSEGVEEQG